MQPRLASRNVKCNRRPTTIFLPHRNQLRLNIFSHPPRLVSSLSLLTFLKSNFFILLQKLKKMQIRIINFFVHSFLQFVHNVSAVLYLQTINRKVTMSQLKAWLVEETCQILISIEEIHVETTKINILASFLAPIVFFLQDE